MEDEELVEIEPGWLVAAANDASDATDDEGEPWRHEFGEDVSDAGPLSLAALAALLPLPAPLPEGNGLEGFSHGPEEEGPCSLLALPPELLSNIASFLPDHHVSAMRSSCRALCHALDARMARLKLSTLVLPHNSCQYRSMSPPWLPHVTSLHMEESASEFVGRRWSTLAPLGSSPVCLWLLMFGQQLRGLASVQLHHLPYALEAVLALRHTCPNISRLQVGGWAWGSSSSSIKLSFWLADSCSEGLETTAPSPSGMRGIAGQKGNGIDWE